MSVIRRLKFDSGNIAEIGYDSVSLVMEVVFRDVPEYLYTYAKVQPATFCALINAESVGSEFAKSIRARPSAYPFVKSLTGRTLPVPVDTKVKKT